MYEEMGDVVRVSFFFFTLVHYVGMVTGIVKSLFLKETSIFLAKYNTTKLPFLNCFAVLLLEFINSQS